MNVSTRFPSLVAAVLPLIVLTQGIADPVGGNHDPLILGADLAVGLAVVIVTMWCTPRHPQSGETLVRHPGEVADPDARPSAMSATAFDQLPTRRRCPRVRGRR